MKNPVKFMVIMFWGNFILSSSVDVKTEATEQRLNGIVSNILRIDQKVTLIDQDVQKIFNFLNEFQPKFTKLCDFCMRLEILYNAQNKVINMRGSIIEEFDKKFSQKIKELEEKINQNDNFLIEK